MKTWVTPGACFSTYNNIHECWKPNQLSSSSWCSRWPGGVPRWSRGGAGAPRALAAPWGLGDGRWCLRANVQPLPVVHSCHCSDWPMIHLAGCTSFLMDRDWTNCSTFWILLFILDHSHVLRHLFWSQSHHMLKLFILTWGLLQTASSPVPPSLLLGMWELLGMSAPTVRSSWPGPCFIHLPVPSTLQVAGSFADTRV